jgi:hypothetical protein
MSKSLKKIFLFGIYTCSVLTLPIIAFSISSCSKSNDDTPEDEPE